MQTQMQRMIDLQYETQRVDRAYYNDTGGQQDVAAVPMMLQKQQPEHGGQEEAKSNNAGSSLSSKEKEVIEGGIHHLDTADNFVGVGTVVFNEAKIQQSRRNASVDSDTTSTGFVYGIRQPSDYTMESVDAPKQPQPSPSLTKSNAQQSLLFHQGQQQQHRSYGATENATSAMTPSASDEQLLVQRLQNEFFHEDPRIPPDVLYRGPVPPETTNKPPPPPPLRRRHRSLCGCLLHPIVSCCSALWHSEHLHRSFCYGAIDGLLTGAGIVSTFCGMNLLSVQANNSPQIRALVVAFTAATCCADAVCMAIGHVWTTVLQQQQHAAERATARAQLDHNKADSKGLLVDMLLAKGMLKIDAMSLADTLEGYPDLFVSAVTGDSLAHDGRSPRPGPPRPAGIDGREAFHLEEELLYEQSMAHPHQHPAMLAPPPPPPPHRSFPSYGSLTEYHMDPDAWTVKLATSEARNESISMMLGFSLFSVVPSLIYTLVPAVLFGSHDQGGKDSPPHATINPNTLVISLTACVMWCLGVWKSRFLDSNWLLFGVETVLVLLLCIAVAYGLGTLLNKLFLPADYLLEVVASTSPTATVSGHAKTVATTIAETSSSSTSKYSSNGHF